MSYSPVNQDDVDESHGAVTVTLDDDPGYDVVGQRDAAVPIRDDDGDLVTLTLENQRVRRGAENVWDARAGEGTTVRYQLVALTEEGTFDDGADLTRYFGGTSFSASVATVDGEAMSPSDFTALADTKTFTFADFAPQDEQLQLGLDVEVETKENDDDGPTENDDKDDDEIEERFLLRAERVTGTHVQIVLGERDANDYLTSLETDMMTALTGFNAVITLTEGPEDGKLRICQATDDCTEEDAPTVYTEGRLEMVYENVWGTICDDYWTTIDAAVACRQLGHRGAERTYLNSAYGGAAQNVPVWLDNVVCAGDEDRLMDCPRAPRADPPDIGDHNCGDHPTTADEVEDYDAGGEEDRHREDAGVLCTACPDDDSDGTDLCDEDANDPALMFRLPDDATEKRGSASLTVAAGGMVSYWVRLSHKPIILQDEAGRGEGSHRSALRRDHGREHGPEGGRDSHAGEHGVARAESAASGHRRVDARGEDAGRGAGRRGGRHRGEGQPQARPRGTREERLRGHPRADADGCGRG